MRKHYDSLRHLMWAYEEVKLSLSSMSSVIPSKDQPKAMTPGRATQSSKEDRLIFVADVELFLKHINRSKFRPIPIRYFLKIFEFAFCPTLAGRRDTYGKLLRHLHSEHSKRSRVPRSILNRGNLHAIVKDLRNKAEKYYKSKGLIGED